MTNFFKYAGMALIAGAFVACSDDLAEAPNQNNPVFDENGNGFMALSLGLPSSNGTRANTDFQDPTDTPKEYQVENITLVLFSGADENSAKLRSAYSLNDQTSKFTKDDQIQVTSKANIVAAINRTGIETSDNIYAFIILNDHGFYHVKKSATLNTTTLYEGGNGGGGDELTGMTFADFRKLELNETGRDYSSQSFFMSNVPVTTVPGGNTTVDPSADTHTLVQIDRSKIYGSKSQAEANVAAIINVERALAKITVVFDTDGAGATSGTITDGTLTYDMMNWIIDNTNPLTYVTRNFRQSDYESLKSAWPISYVNSKSTLENCKHRFVSNTWIDAAENPNYSYRTFWAVDANYEGAGDAVHKLITIFNKTFDEISSVEPLRNNKDTYYCTENTFNVQNQSEKNTTRLVVAAKFNNGNDFYTMEQNATTLYQPGAGTVSGTIGAKVYEILANRVNLGEWMKKFKNPDWEDPVTVADFIKLNFAPNPHVAGADTITVTFNDATDDGLFTDKDAAKAAFSTGGDNSLQTITDKYLGREFTFYHFKGGLAYYTALIKHFGAGSDGYACEAPWVQSEHEGVENSTAGVYVGKNAADLSGDYMEDWATAEKNYLGRYGIVRNNWYDIKVTGVRAIGSSVIPDITNSDTPDDQVKNYISVKINITPWVMRTQSVVL